MAISKISSLTINNGIQKSQTVSDKYATVLNPFNDNSLKHLIDFDQENFGDSVGNLSFTVSGVKYAPGVNGNGKSAVIIPDNGGYADTSTTLSGTGAISYSFWAYTNSFSGNYRVPTRQLLLGVGNFGTNNQNIDLEANCYDTSYAAPNADGFSNQYGIHFWGNGVSFDKKVIYDEWVHIVFSYDGGGTFNSSTCRMWINGKGPYYPNRSFTATIPSNYRVCIGRRYYTVGGADLPSNGKLDKIRIFNKALTQAEALYLYNNGVAI